MVKLKYNSLIERENIINSMKVEGLVVIAEHNIIEGDFLIFGTEDERNIPEEPIDELEQLKQELAEQKALINAMLGVTE